MSEKTASGILSATGEPLFLEKRGRGKAPGGAVMAGGYANHGASTNKNSMIGWLVNGGSAEDDIDLQGSTLRTRARDLYAGGGLGRSAPATLVTSVVGWGIQPKPKPDTKLLNMTDEAAAEWQRNALREFTMWAKSPMCDASRQNNFWEIQELAFRAMLMSGDVFALFGQKENRRNPYSLTLRLIEADRVSTPDSEGESEARNEESGSRIVDGVEINREGEVVKYHIASYHPLAEETQDEITWTAVEAYGQETGMPNILHIMTMERPEQRRGIPFVSAMIEQIKQLDRYLDSELAASIVAAMLTVFIESDAQDDGEYAINDNIDEGDKVTDDQMKVELGNGSVYELPPGKRVSSVNPQRAPSAFDSFVGRMVTMVASSVEIPPEVLLHQYNSNYTAARAAALDFWRVVKRYRQRFIDSFNQPVYEQWLSEAVALGRIEAPGFFDDPAVREAWCGCEWIGASQGHVNPEKEVNAARTRMELGLSTGELEAMEYNGSDWMENMAQRGKEIRQMLNEIPPEARGVTETQAAPGEEDDEE